MVNPVSLKKSIAGVGVFFALLLTPLSMDGRISVAELVGIHQQ